MTGRQSDCARKAKWAWELGESGPAKGPRGTSLTSPLLTPLLPFPPQPVHRLRESLEALIPSQPLPTPPHPTPQLTTEGVLAAVAGGT